MPIYPGSRCSWPSRFRRLLAPTQKRPDGALLFLRRSSVREVLEFLSLSEAPPLQCRSYFDFR